MASMRATALVNRTSSELEHDWLADRAVADGGHPRLVRSRDLYAFHLRDDRAEQRLRFHRRQRAADASVDPVPPAERVSGVSIEPVDVRILPKTRVAVGR